MTSIATQRRTTAFLLVVAALFCLTAGPAVPQQNQCRTAPVGTSSATCASESFVTESAAAAGNVRGPASSTAGHLATFADTTGKVIQDGGTPATVTSVGCGTGLSGGTITTSGTCALAFNSATLQATPSNPSSTTSTSDVMMGLGVSTCRITPTVSGRLRFEVIGVINSLGGSGSTATARYGTGAGPANGAAASGTTVGNTVPVAGSGATNLSTPFKAGGIITGASVGTAIWIDLSLRTSNAANAASINNLSCNADEF